MHTILRKIFYSGLIGISLFEILNVYFIMPFPGSQEMRSIDIAYFLYSSRWYFRILFALMISAGAINAFKTDKKWLPSVFMIIALGIIYLFNFKMVADSMFKQPKNLVFSQKSENRVNDSSLVVCVYQNGVAKGYPVQFIAYHHQIQDTVGGIPLIITYCNVCRTGRAYEPIVNGHHEVFRLVGMDHFNAMFEDATSKSWWRQSTGEAITGPLKGKQLPEVESMQLTIKKLFELYPTAYIMQSDKASAIRYDTLRKFERGKSISKLTRSDTLSWERKSWIVGIEIGSAGKAYDWITLKQQKIINDTIGIDPVLIAITSDGESFVAFRRPEKSINFTIKNDTLYSNGLIYDLTGRCLNDPTQKLTIVKAYQEFWHSWRTFHPNSVRYEKAN